ncbi:MAG: hypothetical protein CMO44_19215 [Verrucomicrobiales bacterium]|nr:hypothetical protein [Verrucomicrobiales bacterium]
MRQESGRGRSGRAVMVAGETAAKATSQGNEPMVATMAIQDRPRDLHHLLLRQRAGGAAASRGPLLPLINSPKGLPSPRADAGSPKVPQGRAHGGQSFPNRCRSPENSSPPLAPLDLDEPGPRYDRRGRNVEYGGAREFGRTSDAECGR